MDLPSVPQHRPKKTLKLPESVFDSLEEAESALNTEDTETVSKSPSAEVIIGESKEEETPNQAPIIPSSRPASKSPIPTTLPSIPASRPKPLSQSPVPETPSRPLSRPSRKVSTESSIEASSESRDDSEKTELKVENSEQSEDPIVNQEKPQGSKSSDDHDFKLESNEENFRAAIDNESNVASVEDKHVPIPSVPSHRPQKVENFSKEATEATLAKMESGGEKLDDKTLETTPNDIISESESPTTLPKNVSEKESTTKKESENSTDTKESTEIDGEERDEDQVEDESKFSSTKLETDDEEKKEEKEPASEFSIPIIPPSRPSRRPNLAPLKISSQPTKEKSLETPVYDQVIDIYNSSSPEALKSKQNSIKEEDTTKSLNSPIDFAKASLSEAADSKKPPPRVPKKPSSKIAAFQQMLAERQREDANMFLNKPLPPKTRPKVRSTFENESIDEKQEDNSPPTEDEERKPIPVVNKLGTSQFARNLNGMIGFALPGMTAPGSVPPFARPTPSGNDADDDKAEKENEGTANADVRKGRARGPRGKRLPGNVKNKLIVNDETLGNVHKFTIRTVDTWSFGIETELQKEASDVTVPVDDQNLQESSHLKLKEGQSLPSNSAFVDADAEEVNDIKDCVDGASIDKTSEKSSDGTFEQVSSETKDTIINDIQETAVATEGLEGSSIVAYDEENVHSRVEDLSESSAVSSSPQKTNGIVLKEESESNSTTDQAADSQLTTEEVPMDSIEKEDGKEAETAPDSETITQDTFQEDSKEKEESLEEEDILDAYE